MFSVLWIEYGAGAGHAHGMNQSIVKPLLITKLHGMQLIGEKFPQLE